MKKKYKVLVSVLLCATVLAGSAYGFLSYKSSKDNVFTLGSISGTLEENKFVQKTTIVPNQTVDKNPTLTAKGNVDVYMFMTVQIPEYTDDGTTWKELFAIDGLQTGWAEFKAATEDTTAHTKTHYLCFGSDTALTKVTATESGVTKTAFTGVKVADYSMESKFMLGSPATMTAISSASASALSQTVVVTGYLAQANYLPSITTSSTPSQIFDVVYTGA